MVDLLVLREVLQLWSEYCQTVDWLGGLVCCYDGAPNIYAPNRQFDGRLYFWGRNWRRHFVRVITDVSALQSFLGLSIFLIGGPEIDSRSVAGFEPRCGNPDIFRVDSLRHAIRAGCAEAFSS